MSIKKIKKAVIREDLLAITENYQQAIILNQFIYWSERVADADEFIKSENEIAKNNGECERELFYGWIYKTAEELSQEVMLGLSASQTRKYINKLVDLGFIAKRNNPKYKWDRTLQYRVNLVNIAKALKEKSYPLSDYKIEIPDDDLSNAHTGAINEVQEENQSVSDNGAIPEINNRDYNNIDYCSENTDMDTSEKEKIFSEVEGMYTSFPEENKERVEKPKSRYIPEDYTEEQLIEHIYPIVSDEMDKQLEDGEYKPIDEFIEVVRIFHRKYKQNTGKRHRVLADISYREIVRKFLFPTENMMNDDSLYDIECYSLMIDKYFKIEMNKYGKYQGKITKSLSHFMCDKVREYIYFRIFLDGEED